MKPPITQSQAFRSLVRTPATIIAKAMMMAMMNIVLYCRFRYAIAPSCTAEEICLMRSVPAFSFMTEYAR